MTEKKQTGHSRPLKVAWFFVNLFYGLSWLAAILLTGLTVAMWTTDFNVRYATLPIEVTLEESAGGEILEPIEYKGSIPISGFSNLKVRAERLPNLKYTMFMPAVLLAGILWLMFLLRGLLSNVRQGKPFSPKNPLLLKQIGWLVTIGGPVYTIFQHIYARIYMNLIDIPGATYNVASDGFGNSVVAGLIIVVIAQVYDEAITIKAESELTI